MALQAPWTDIGSLQSDVREIRSQIHNKADNHEIHSINRRLDSLEHTCRELSSQINEVLYRVQRLEENQIATQ